MFSTNFLLAHDEAEHLHVIHALSRGERPYLDFIENHPVLPHALLAGFSFVSLHSSTVESYFTLKAGIALYFIGSMLMIGWLLHLCIRMDEKPKAKHTALFTLISLSSLGAWQVSASNDYALSGIWNLRPDWVCYFHALLCICLHFRVTQEWLGGKEIRLKNWMLVSAALNGAIATAIMAKSAFLFLPYLLTCLTIAFATASCRFISQLRWRIFLRDSLVFGVTFSLCFVALVAIEIDLSRATWESYWKSNFAYNTVKHLVLSALDFNPFYILSQINGLSLLGNLGAMILSFSYCIHMSRTGQYGKLSAALFACFTLLINALLPAFNNGAAWGQYFIPSLMATVILGSLLLAQFFHVISHTTELLGSKASFHLRTLASLVLIFIALVFTGMRFSESLTRYDNFHFVRSLYIAKAGDSTLEFLPDRWLPSDLTYLTFSPKEKPVRARAWGYFFMLSPDLDAYPTLQRLGLSHDYSAMSKELFAKSPPDVILLYDAKDMAWRSLLMSLAHNGNLDWLLEDQRIADYRCLARKPLQIQVRKSIQQRFLDDGWVACMGGDIIDSPITEWMRVLQHNQTPIVSPSPSRL